MRRLAWRTTVVLATAMGLMGLWWFAEIVVMLLLSLTLAAILRPLVEHLMRRGLPRWAALLGAFGGGGLTGLVLAYFAITAIVQDLGQAGRDLATSYEYIQKHWPQGTEVQQTLVARLPAMESFSKALTEMPLASALQQLLGVSVGLFELGANLLIIVVLSMYWSANQNRFERLWLSLLPVERRIWARELWRRVESEVGRYMGSEILQSIVAGIVLAILLNVSGFPYPVTMSILAAVAWLIPWAGPTLSLTAIWFAAFLNLADITTMAAISRGIVGSVLTLAVYIVLELLVQPQLLGFRRYSSLLIALVALGMADMLGLVGLVLGPPLAVAIQLFLEQYFWPTTNEPEEVPHTDLGRLQERLNELRVCIEPQHHKSMASILERVGFLLDEAQSLSSSPVSSTPSSASLGISNVPASTHQPPQSP